MLAVADDLHFDVAGLRHQAFGVHRTLAEGSLRFGHAAGIGFGQVSHLLHHTHAAPTTAAHGLEHHAASAMGGHERLCIRQRHRVRAARQHRHPAVARQQPCAGLVAQQSQLRRAGADEDQACVGTSLRKVGSLTQETVAGVHRVAATFARATDEAVHIQVGSRRHRGQARRKRSRALQAHVGRRLRDAQGDFAAVGDEDVVDHGAAF